jgi:hypothetical protein
VSNVENRELAGGRGNALTLLLTFDIPMRRYTWPLEYALLNQT